MFIYCALKPYNLKAPKESSNAAPGSTQFLGEIFNIHYYIVYETETEFSILF